MVVLIPATVQTLPVGPVVTIVHRIHVDSLGFQRSSSGAITEKGKLDPCRFAESVVLLGDATSDAA